jgi:hypothetical protein
MNQGNWYPWISKEWLFFSANTATLFIGMASYLLVDEQSSEHQPIIRYFANGCVIRISRVEMSLAFVGHLLARSRLRSHLKSRAAA